jgi:hypothetical protein
MYLFVSISSRVSANGIFCDGKLISIGDTKYEVSAKCGDPDFKDIRFEKRIKRDFFRDLFQLAKPNQYEREVYREPLFVEEEVMIEEWTYNLGPTRFIRYLTFENGKLVNISTGDYGFY